MADTQYEKLDGNAELVLKKGQRYQAIADAIERASKTLQSIVDDASTTAKSMDETRSLASDVHDDITKATVRYRDTGDALVAYSTPLESAISSSETAATHIATLESDLTAARSGAERARWHRDSMSPDAPDADASDARSAVTRAENHVSDLEGQLRFWQGRWDDAKASKDGAAVTAKNAIDEVVSGAKVHGLKDGFWDKAGEVWDSIYKVVKIICDVAGVLAIFLSWVPFLGQVLLVLAAVGAILSVVNAVFDAARGKGSWWAVVGAAGLAALSLFGGKLISVVAKYAKARVVVTSASRMAGGEAKAVFGSTLLKSSRKIFAQSTGSRVTEVLKSPFVRTSTDKEVFGLVTHGEGLKALKTMFPNPFSGMGMRAMFSNDDVAELYRVSNLVDSRLPGIAGTPLIDGVTSAASSVASVGGIALTGFNVVRNGVAVGQELSVGDADDAASPGVSLGTYSMNGPYGQILGGAVSLAGDF